LMGGFQLDEDEGKTIDKAEQVDAPLVYLA
jgi:hypothetical protein